MQREAAAAHHTSHDEEKDSLIVQSQLLVSKNSELTYKLKTVRRKRGLHGGQGGVRYGIQILSCTREWAGRPCGGMQWGSSYCKPMYFVPGLEVKS